MVQFGQHNNMNKKIKGYVAKKQDPEEINLPGMMGALGIVAKNVIDTKNELVEKVTEKIEDVEDRVSKIEKDFENNSTVLDETVEMMRESMDQMTEYVNTLESGKDGIDADEEKIAEMVASKFPKFDEIEKRIVAQIPKPIDIKALSKQVISSIPQSKASLKVIRETLEMDPMSILDKINSLPEGKFKLKTTHIDGLDQTISAFKNQMKPGVGYLHGGGDTVTAGSNITITTNAAGQKVISSTGGGSDPSIGGPIIGGLSGSVLFVNPDGIIAQNNTDFNWDDSLHAFKWGTGNTASGVNSTAFGNNNEATQIAATVWGDSNHAIGQYSTVFGIENTASGIGSLAYGSGALASGDYSTAFGAFTVASLSNSMAWGNTSLATADNATAFGDHNEADAMNATAWGDNTHALGQSSTAFGSSGTASGAQSTTWGTFNTASGHSSTAFGITTQATTDTATAWGTSTIASGINSTAFGATTQASGEASVASGSLSIASGVASFASGAETVASGIVAVAMGYKAVANNTLAFALGDQVTASGIDSFASGTSSVASGVTSTAMGSFTLASGGQSFAVGYHTTASGGQAIAVGDYTVAAGADSFASGFGTLADGIYTESHNFGTIAHSFASTAVGSHNLGNGTPGSWIATDTIFEVGIGGNGSYGSPVGRANGFEVLKNGTLVVPVTPTTSAGGYDVLSRNTSTGAIEKVSGTVPTVSGTTNYVSKFTSSSSLGNSLIYDDGTSVGIGTTSPTALLTLAGDGAILATGTLGAGTPFPATVATGPALMWFPNKGAFRAGEAQSPYWDNANVGAYSAAFGQRTQASGGDSFAIGYGTSATVDGTFAGGANTLASGFYSIAFGNVSTASGTVSAAFGSNNTASGNGAFVAGSGNTGSGYGTMTAGSELLNASYISAVFGSLNVGGGSTTTWVLTDPLFEVGNGVPASGVRSNALTILKNGFVGVGTATPAAKLNLSGNISAAAWTTDGINLRTNAATYTDTTSTGTVTLMGVNAIAAPTIAASSATTYTTAATFYIGNGPTASTNVTITNGRSLYVQGQSTFNGGLATAVGSTTSNFYASGGSISATTATPTAQFAGSSIANFRALFNGVTSTSIATGTVAANAIFASVPYTTFTSGTHALIANVVVNPIATITNAGATVTSTASLYIDGAGTGGTNNFAVYVNSGSSYFGGNIQTSISASNGNMFIAAGNTIGGSVSSANWQFGGSSNVNIRNAFGGQTSGTLTANNNYANTIIGLAPITTAATGTHALLANFVVNPLGTVTSGGSTVTDTASFYIGNAGAGGTNNYAMLVAAGTSRFNGRISAAGGLETNAGASTTSNLFANNGGGSTGGISTASLQFGGSSQVRSRGWFAGSTSSTLTAADNYANWIVGASPITTAATGTHAVLANLAVRALGTVTSGGSAVTSTASLYIDGAGTGGTTNYAILVASGSISGPQVLNPNNAITAVANAATVPVTSRINTVTNSSAATLTITLATTGAIDGQMLTVRVLDFSAAAQTLTWVNTENSTVTVPGTSNGSTTLPLTVTFQYNGNTNKWRCLSSV